DGPDRARGPRSHHGGPTPEPASSTHRVYHLLHAVANTLGTKEGRADLASGHAAVGREDPLNAAGRRAPPPLRPHRRIAVARRRPSDRQVPITAALNTSAWR